MTTYETTRQVDLPSLPFPAVQWGSGSSFTIEADVDAATLKAAVDTAPDAGLADRNRDVIEQRVKDHLADLRTIAGSSGTLTGAQLSNAVRVLARGQIAVIRLAASILDGTD